MCWHSNYVLLTLTSPAPIHSISPYVLRQDISCSPLAVTFYIDFSWAIPIFFHFRKGTVPLSRLVSITGNVFWPSWKSDRAKLFRVLTLSRNVDVTDHFYFVVCGASVHEAMIGECHVQTLICVQNRSAYSADLGCTRILDTTVLVIFYN